MHGTNMKMVYSFYYSKKWRGILIEASRYLLIFNEAEWNESKRG